MSVVLLGWTTDDCGFVSGDVVKVIRSVVMSDESVMDTEMASITITQLLDNFGNNGNTLVVNCSQLAGAVSANSVGTSTTGLLFRMLPRHEFKPGDTDIYLDVEFPF